VRPRECENENCDYVTGVDGNDRPFTQWEHVDECDGPVAYSPPKLEDVHKRSFAAFLLNGQK
jgi:hypothetical protein